ncbi:transposase family protein [Streptomyces sp. NPDC001750]|uniref:ATP-binding protein n=1 Tax=unclassified Streptomyces TaxID=2593676 RepID=UPI003686C694
MAPKTGFSRLSVLVVEDVADSGDAVVVSARTRDVAVPCPVCGTPTAKVHGYHRRTVRDVPIDGRQVVVHLRVRRLACPALGCWRQTFCEQIPGLLVTNAVRYAGGPIVLRLIHGNVLICEVSDPSNTQPRLCRARWTDEGGRGLYLVAQLTTRWGSRYGQRGKTTRVDRGKRHQSLLRGDLARRSRGAGAGTHGGYTRSGPGEGVSRGGRPQRGRPPSWRRSRHCAGRSARTSRSTPCSPGSTRRCGAGAYFRPGGVLRGLLLPAQLHVAHGLEKGTARAPQDGPEEDLPPLLRP